MDHSSRKIFFSGSGFCRNIVALVCIVAASMLILLGIGASDSQAAKFPAASPQIQYFGRWDAEGGVYRCGYGATYIKADFTGTNLTADIDGSGIWWRVSIDGGEFRRLKAQGEDTVLAENLSPGQHRVLLVRSTEGEAGISTFRGFAVDDGATLLSPEPMKDRRLEFVGDSITAGLFNDGKVANGNYSDMEDNDMSYGPQLARMLDADYSVIAKSGQGVVHNYAEEWPGKGVHASDSYVWTFFSNEFRPGNLVWDTGHFPVDAIIVSIGTNDFSDRNRRPTAEEFISGYKKLIDVVREKNPGKPIICTEPLPAYVGADARNWIKQVVEEARERGDQRIYFIAFNEDKPLLERSDYVDGTHPTKQGSTKTAEYLKDKVAAILGWE